MKDCDSFTNRKKITAVGSGAKCGNIVRKKITILMCDIVGSTELAYLLELEQLSELMMGYYQVCSSSVESRGGNVIRYVGDAVLAVFEPTPQSFENPAIESVMSGIQIIEHFENNTVQTSASGHELSVRVTVVSGFSLCTDLRCSGGLTQHAVFGRLPFLADRLKSLSTPNSIVVDEETATAIPHKHYLQPMGSASVKGIPATVHSWKVDRARMLPMSAPG